jgi:hypothetical protein
MPNAPCTAHLEKRRGQISRSIPETFERVILFEQRQPLRLGNPQVVPRNR